MKQYDCIVVGGGITGMIMSALLASEGKKILLVEHSSQLGGLIHTIVYENKIFPLGAHHLSGCAENGLVYKVLKKVGIDIEKVIKPVKHMDVIVDNKMYTLPLFLPKLKTFLEDNFPGEKIDEFIAVIRRYYDYYISNSTFGLQQFFKETSNISYREFLNQYFKNEHAIQVLFFLSPIYGGLCFEDSAFSHLSLLISYFCGTCYFEPSIQILIEMLKKRLKQLQVEILFNTDYVTVISNKEKVIGIIGKDLRTKENLSLYSQNVILTINPEHTLREKFPKTRATQRISTLEKGAVAVRIVGKASRILKNMKSCDVVNLGNSKSQKIFLSPDDHQLPIYMLSYCESINRFDEETSFPFMLTFLTKCTENISCHKLEQHILSLLKTENPEFYSTIEKYKIFPNVVYQALSYNDTGSAFGWKRETRTVLYTNSFAPTINSIQNLYICGNWSTDFGIYGAFRSSERVFRIMKQEG